MTGALDGLRVLDLSWGIAGPMVGMLLADQGAVVTKIEPPGGDPFRFLAGYRAWNRGKRSAVLDLKHPVDRATFYELARRSDVVLESFSPGTATRLGIGWAELSALNDRLVYACITGYGKHPEHANRPGYDALVAARSGLQWEQRGPDGGVFGHIPSSQMPLPDLYVDPADRGGPMRDGPLFSASHWPSLGAFFLAASGIAAALYVRERTGRGQLVETSLMQGALAAGAFAWQRPEHPDTPDYPSWLLDARAPQESFRCADGRWVHYAMPSPRLVLSQKDRPKLTVNDRTTGPRQDPDRLGMDIWELAVYCHYYPEMVKVFAQFPAADWVALGREVGAPLAPVRSTREALMIPAYLREGTVVEVSDPRYGTLRQAGNAFFLESNPTAIGRPEPELGAHTDVVRQEAREPLTKRPSLPGRLPGPAPLSGIRVVDFGMAVAGPFGTQVLAELGASVIKVHTLYDGPFDLNQLIKATSRGKRSIAVDLKTPDGQEVLRRLVAGADVVAHNMRLSAARRLGLDYATLSQINPRLIYSHIRGFEKGSASEQPANDQVAAGISGVQWEDGACDEGGRPLWALTPMGDLGAGYLSAVAVMLALAVRERTGRGQEVNTSLLNACLLNNSYVSVCRDGTEIRQPHLDVDHRGLGAMDMLYPTATEWICLEAVLPEHWPRLCEALGRPDLESDSRFSSPEARAAHRKELAQALEATFLTQPASHWTETLDRHQVPCEVSRQSTADDLFDDPVLAQLGWTSSYVHPVLGKLDQVGLLVDLSLTPGRNRLRSPVVGENSREILTELAFSPEEVGRLVAEHIVADGA